MFHWIAIHFLIRYLPFKNFAVCRSFSITRLDLSSWRSKTTPRQIMTKLLQITMCSKLQITTAFFITRYDQVRTNCDRYKILGQDYYKLELRQLLKITTKQGHSVDVSIFSNHFNPVLSLLKSWSSCSGPDPHASTQQWTYNHRQKF